MTIGDILIDDLEFSVRVKNALKAQPSYRTLADLAAATDAQLLALDNFGRTSLSEVRAMVRQHAAPFDRMSDVVAWALSHPHLIRAVMAGEAEIRHLTPVPTAEQGEAA